MFSGWGNCRLRIVGAVAAALAGIVPLARAADPKWISIGPPGGGVIRVLALDPSAPATVYAGGGTEISPSAFRTAYRGETWERASVGLSGGPIVAVAVDPNRPGTAYACSSFPGFFFRTGTSGASWEILQPAVINFDCGALLALPGSPSTLYAAINAGVVRSTDGGTTWVSSKSGLPPTQFVDLAAAPGAAGAVPALYTAGYQGVYRSRDGGGTWTSVTASIGDPFTQKIAVFPSDADLVWAATSAGVFVTRNGGASWTLSLAITMSGGVPGQGRAIAIDPYDSAHVLVSTTDGTFATRDGGSTWRPAGIPATVYALAFDPAAPSTIYAGADGGVYKSGDGGATWKLEASGMTMTSIRTVAVPPWAGGSVWATADGVPGSAEYASSDGGSTWSPMDRITGNPSGPLRPVDRFVFVFDPSSAGTAYAATETSSPESVYKTIDGRRSWSAVGPNASMRPLGAFVSLVIDPEDPRILYFGSGWCFLTQCGGGIYKTTDAGASWTAVGLPTSALAVDPGAHTRIYAAGLAQPGIPAPSPLFRSDDGGASWIPLTGYTGFPVRELAVAPGSPSSVLAAAQDGRLWRSRDAGGTWAAASYGIPVGAGVSTILVDPGAARTLYAGTSQGVYRSVDGGDTWLPLGKTIPAFDVGSLALDAPNRTLYAGTFTSGAWRLSLADVETATCSPTLTALCVNDGRFRAEVSWRSADGAAGTGTVFPMTTDAGAFWFFSPNNLELVVKVVDGRPFNDRFWIFGGQLTDVEYTLTVTDTRTGAVWTHRNPPGSLASFADTSAFPP